MGISIRDAGRLLQFLLSRLYHLRVSHSGVRIRNGGEEGGLQRYLSNRLI